MKVINERFLYRVGRGAAFLLCVLLIAGCFPAAAEEEKTDRNRVFYEIFVGSFSDSDGDGTGDLRGIINRMDYLNDGDPLSDRSLGVEGIWLTPVWQSSSYHKYNVDDYYSVDISFGSEEDLRELISLCHERGVLLILDLPVNHTGSGNEWFELFCEAHRMADSESEWYNFYSWLPADEKYPAGRRFMPVYGTDIVYECNFSDDMPELDTDRPEVREAVLSVARYWLEMGVDGFRFDAAKYICFGDNAASVAFWEWFVGELKKIKPDVYTVAEVWDPDGVTEKYQSVCSCFDFTVSQVSGLIAETAKSGHVDRYTAYVQKYTEKLEQLGGAAVYTPFIANHDTDRAAGYMTVSSGLAQTAANLYLLGPGSPFIYYGEEIGLRGSRGGANTDANRRLAMLWGDGDPVCDPIGATYDPAKQTPLSVRDLEKADRGILKYYRRLLAIRRAYPEIADGTYSALTFGDGKTGGFTSELNGSRVTVVHNTGRSAVTVDLTGIGGACRDTLCAFIGMGDASLENGVLTLGEHTSAVLR